jgi:Domain of Unknown Function (DUF1259)
MKTMCAVLLVLLASTTGNVAAEEPDADVIARITGIKPDVKNGIAKISVPRADIPAVIDGVKMAPFQGLTSWAAFESAGGKTMVMGDLTMMQNEVNPAMSAALDNGLEVTALHNHFFYDRPNVFFMHIGGMGTTEELATGVQKALDAIKAAGKAAKSPSAAAPCGEFAAGFGGRTIPAKNTIDSNPLETILGGSAQMKDGIAKFSFGRKTSMHGAEAGEAMGVNTWAAFAGSQQAALVDGDFAMLEDELQGVLKALRHSNINVVAIHNHMTHEEPRIMFLHFWGKGPAEELAHGIKSALETQKK